MAAGIPAAGAVRHQPGLLRVDLVQQGLDFRVIRAAVGAGGEGPLNECVCLRGQQIGSALRSPGQADQRPGQGVLQKARPVGLFALEAK